MVGGGEEQRLQRAQGSLGTMSAFIILIRVMVSQVYTYVKTKSNFIYNLLETFINTFSLNWEYSEKTE